MLILASASPRRHDLLSLIGIEFQVLTSDIDESVIPAESPQDYVLRLAVSKSLAINPLSAERLVVIAADTAVIDNGHILGKPGGPRQAASMLEKLRGRTHQVLSGIAVRDTQTDEIFTDLCTTLVEMRNYSGDEIDTYITSGDPMDKAGAYAIQHTGFNPVAQITGCYANVVGLPLCHLGHIVKRLGVSFHENLIQGCRSNGEYQCHLVDRINSMGAADVH
jgi:MAF protein